MEGLISTGKELDLFCMWQEATGGFSTGRKIRQWGVGVGMLRAGTPDRKLNFRRSNMAATWLGG